MATSATVVVHVDPPDPRDRSAGLCRELDRWERQATIDATRVEEIRAQFDLAVRARAVRLRDRIEPRTRAAGGAALSAGRLRVRAVRAAYDAVNRQPPVVTESTPEIDALVERWDRYCERRTRNEAHLIELATRVADAERAVTAATDAVAEAKEDARPVMLEPDDEAASTSSTPWPTRARCGARASTATRRPR